jgi:phosphorylcholine metabolism protein LicD
MKNYKSFYKQVLFFFETLNEYNINYWIDAGTLLKTYKSNFKIESLMNSSDIDIGFYHDDYKKILDLCKKLEKNGFKIKVQNDYAYFEDIIKIFFPHNESKIPIHIDLYIYKYSKINKEYYRRCINKHFKNSILSKILNYLILFLSSKNEKKINKKIRNLLIPLKFRKKLTKIIFENLYFVYGKSIWVVVPENIFNNLDKKTLIGKNEKIEIKIPNLTEEYLKFRYGDLWNKNNKNWRPSDGKYLRIRRINHINEKPMKIEDINEKFLFFESKDKIRNFRFEFSNSEIKKIVSNDE